VGARRPDLVPPDVCALLEEGGVSVNHMEQMAFDMGILLGTAFPDLADRAPRLRENGLVSKMRTGGEVLFEAYGREAWTLAATHQSDTVRGWAVMAVSACRDLSLAERLAATEPFADDPHFAVREWAWLAVRPFVIERPDIAIDQLAAWTHSDSPRIRRFASEVTRPRGVWSAHVPLLKRTPEMATGLLSALSEDPSRYVQNSVGNWLNDASKSRPDWVESLCGSWLESSHSAATQAICRRAMRTIERDRARMTDEGRLAI